MSRAGRGRPLRFVGAVGLGWIGLRLVALWPPPSGVPPGRMPLSLANTAAHSIFVRSPPGPATARRAIAATPRAGLRPAEGRAASVTSIPRAWVHIAPVPSTGQTEGAGATLMPIPDSGLPRPPPPSPSAADRRWRGSAWLSLRPGQGIGAAPAAGQLGGSQYGLRLLHGLDSKGRLAAFGRIAGPVRGAGAEAALGLEWRPFAGPLRLAVEHRFALDGGKGGPGVGAVTGVYRDVAGFRLEAYGQAGTILRDRMEPYADGALRLTRTVPIQRVAAPAIGIGIWGGAQRGAQRLDIGPTIVARLPSGALHARLALDWRQRIAGNARPGSGIALTLGSDF